MSRRPSWFPTTKAVREPSILRDGIAPPGWETASRMNGSPREPRGPAGATGVSVGARCKGQPEQGVEPRSGVGPVHSTVEPLEGNERGEGRDRPGGSPPEKAGVRTQSRFALPLKLWRVYEAAQRNKQARFTALLHHVDVIALERAFRRLSGAQVLESTGKRLPPTSRVCNRNGMISASGCTPGATGRCRCVASIFLNRMAGGGRSASLRWKTRSSKGQWPRSSAPSTRSIFSGSHRASGRDGIRTRRSQRCTQV